jgi:hypothetical protein
LSGRQLPSAGVERERAIESEPVTVDKLPDFALWTKPEVLELDRGHDRKIVVDLDQLDILIGVVRTAEP